MDRATKLRCEDLAREFMKRIEPWSGRWEARVLWTERKPVVLKTRTFTPQAVPAREGVTLNAPWCEEYSREPRLRAGHDEDYPSKPCGSGWERMRDRDQWRHDTHVLRMPDVPSPWEPLLEMWELGAMIDVLVDDESKEGAKCLLIEYSR